MNYPFSFCNTLRTDAGQEALLAEHECADLEACLIGDARVQDIPARLSQLDIHVGQCLACQVSHGIIVFKTGALGLHNNQAPGAHWRLDIALAAADAPNGFSCVTSTSIPSTDGERIRNLVRTPTGNFILFQRHIGYADRFRSVTCESMVWMTPGALPKVAVSAAQYDLARAAQNLMRAESFTATCLHAAALSKAP